MEQQFPLTYGLSKTGLPLIVVKIFDYELCLLLDTGSNRNIIDKQTYDHFIDKLEVPEQSQGVLTLNGVTEGAVINIPFTFEGQQYNELFMCAENTESFEQIKKESGIRIYGILSNNFFLKHGWVLDFEIQKVYKN